MKRLALTVLLLTLGCGLDELIVGYSAASSTGTGGAAGAAGAGATGGQGGCAVDTVRAVERASFTTQSTDPEEVASLDLPAGVAPDGWVLLLSARLASEDDQAARQEVRYLVDGVERGVGQSRVAGNAAGEGGPWQHFDWLEPSASDRHVSVELRSTNALFLATIEDLRVVAFAVPPNADVVFVDEPEEQMLVQPDSTNRIFQTVASVDIAPPAAGDYLVMLTLLGNEAPGQASIGVRAVAPGAEVWPVASAVEPRPYLAQPLHEWQSFTLMRSVHSDGTAVTVDLQVDASGTDGSTLRYVRGLALRHDAFAQVKLATQFDEQVISTARDTVVGELEVATDPCHGAVVAQFVTLHALGLRTVRFGGATFDHDLPSDESKLAYGTFGLLPAPNATITTTVSAPDTTVPLYVRESVIVALELP